MWIREDFDFEYSQCLNQFYQFGLVLSIFLTSDRLVWKPVWKQSFVHFRVTLVTHTSPLNFSWSNLFLLPWRNKRFQLIKPNTSTGKPNKWKPRREKLDLVYIWLVRMLFGNARTHTHTHTHLAHSNTFLRFTAQH